jgi:hypothetical protein
MRVMGNVKNYWRPHAQKRHFRTMLELMRDERLPLRSLDIIGLAAASSKPPDQGKHRPEKLRAAFIAVVQDAQQTRCQHQRRTFAR